MSFIEHIQSHPAIAFCIVVAHAISAEAMNLISVPNIVMQYFQLGAWTVSITVGLITIYGQYKKWKKK